MGILKELEFAILKHPAELIFKMIDPTNEEARIEATFWYQNYKRELDKREVEEIECK
jgi:hypothetical protein